MDNFTQWDMATYFGLSAAVMGAVGALKKLFPSWVDEKEPYLGLAFSYLIGVSTKLFMPGAYDKVHWIPFLLTLLLVAAGAKFGHDYIIDRIISNKPSPEERMEKRVEDKVIAKIEEKK